MEGKGVWSLQLWRSLFRKSERRELQSLNDILGEMVINGEKDEWEWIWAKEISFTVKSFYNQLWFSKQSDERLAMEFPYKLVWEVDIPTNVKVFMWSLFQGRTLTVNRLMHLGWHLASKCVLCNEEESTLHLFQGCTVTSELRRRLCGNSQATEQL
ncbi:hypothetical protein FRX31_007445, partial [Thalictrum thalictroides]